jgi:two-component system, response regulator PdtaR
VVEAGTVAEAKEVLLQGSVDLVFSDINMPNRETGFVLEKWVRRQFPEIKVLLTSGVPQAAEDTRDLIEPLIPKPYRLSMLEGRIERLLCGSRSLVA